MSSYITSYSIYDKKLSDYILQDIIVFTVTWSLITEKV